MSRKCNPFSLLLLSTLPVSLAIAVVARPQAGAAAELHYDSSSCTPDAEGLVYIALGTTVFRWPQDELTLIGDLPRSEKAAAPRPPDPSEPEGCPEHPIQALSFSFLYRYAAIRADKHDPEMPAGAPNSLTLIAARPEFWGLQPMAEKRFRKTCERWGERTVLPEGLIACSVPPTDRSRPRDTWATYYQARPEIHGAPFDRPFVVVCRPGTVTWCKVRYKLFDTVNVSYEFWRERLPISQVIAFDRQLRARIEAHQVTDFAWPSPAEPPRAAPE